jgi:hypothetical protein
MRCLRTIRWLRAWLTAMFVVAQAGGIAPLIYDHTLNLFETTPVAGHVHVQVAATHHGGTSVVQVAEPDADHHHGMLDLHDQCCALHTLAGPLPQPLMATPVVLAVATFAPEDAILIAPGDPTRLERPPRPLPV